MESQRFSIILFQQFFSFYLRRSFRIDDDTTIMLAYSIELIEQTWGKLL
jgi:hypothetical protein